jgi:hypothetical protein
MATRHTRPGHPVGPHTDVGDVMAIKNDDIGQGAHATPNLPLEKWSGRVVGPESKGRTAANCQVPVHAEVHLGQIGAIEHSSAVVDQLIEEARK